MRNLVALITGVAVLVAACSGGEPEVVATPSVPPSVQLSDAPQGSAEASSEAPGLTPVGLQLQWYPQAQFAGYFAAIEQGYYAAGNLDVQWFPGGGAQSPADDRLGG